MEDGACSFSTGSASCMPVAVGCMLDGGLTVRQLAKSHVMTFSPRRMSPQSVPVSIRLTSNALHIHQNCSSNLLLSFHLKCDKILTDVSPRIGWCGGQKEAEVARKKLTDCQPHLLATSSSEQKYLKIAKLIHGTALLTLGWIRKYCQTRLYFLTRRNSVYNFKATNQSHAQEVFAKSKEVVGLLTSKHSQLGQ